MTVGTGVNPDSDIEGYKRLAQGIYASLHKIYPDYIVFFASELSKNTISYVEELFIADDDEFIEGQDYEIVILEDIDNFNDCFEAIEAEIWKFDILSDEKHEIIMDYTSGTKTMSSAMACCGMFYNKDLISVGGDRTTGEVSVGTEIINYQNLYKIYDRFAVIRIRHNFNANRFMACIETLKRIVDLNIEKESFLNLCKAYYYWDNMDFENAYSFLTKVNINQRHFIEIAVKLKKNLKALGIIVNSKSENLKNCYALASLINNSKRRAAEYKYDDAIARLYRSFELIAQIKLSKYNLISSDIDIDVLLEKNVSEDFINYLKKMEEDGKIKIGLTADFLLLNELGDDLGKYYKEHENKIKDLTQKRNNSVLAHGLESQSNEDFENFLQVVVDLALKLDKDMKRFLNETEFSKFDLKLQYNQF